MQGRYDNALKWYNGFFEVRKKQPEENDPKTLEVAFDMARMLEAKGNVRSALKWYVDIFEASLGERFLGGLILKPWRRGGVRSGFVTSLGWVYKTRCTERQIGKRADS